MIRLLTLFFLTLTLASCSQKFEKVRGTNADAAMVESVGNGERLEENQVDNRKVTYRANMTITVEEIEAVGDRVVAIAKSNEGYLLEGNEHYVRIRVHSDSLDNALDQIASLGKLTHRSVNGTDVTDYHTDLNLRLSNSKKTRDRYLQLLKKAKKVSDILLIEKELERISLDIERYNGALRNLETNISYSDVSVAINQKVKPGPIGYIFVGLWKGIKFLFVRN